VEVAVPPVAASAYWGLQSAATFVAARLGTTLRHILQQHSMWHMAQARARAAPLCVLDKVRAGSDSRCARRPAVLPHDSVAAAPRRT